MRIQLSKAALSLAVGALCATAGFAQAPGPGRGPGPGAGGPPPGGNPVVANPIYAVLEMEIAINKPAAEVWKRIGKYCDIGEWFQVPCTITAGKDGEVGAVRSIGREILVGKTELSYTYTQPVLEGQVYNLYHGTMEARPVTATTSKIVYTLLWDNSMLADDAARERDKAQRKQMFEGALNNMKTLAEGGTLPPRGAGGPPRGAGGPPGGARGPGGPGGPGAPGAPGGAR